MAKKTSIILWWKNNCKVGFNTQPKEKIQGMPIHGVRVPKDLAEKVYKQPQNQYHDQES